MKQATAALVLVALVGGGAYAYYRSGRTGPAPTVSTAPITRGDIAETVGATGTLQAVTTVQVGTQVSGTIQELHADFNSLVKKGQVLARLDPSLFQTQIEQARANLIRAQADLERLKVSLDDARTKLTRARELAARQLIPQIELDTADVNVRSIEAQLRSSQAQVSQAQASLNQTEVNLAHTVIRAPIDGLVISRNVDVGQTVAASMSAPTLYVLAADLTKMQVVANLDESDVGRIRPGQRVAFRVDAYPAEDFVGTVAQVRLQPIVQQNVVTYATVIDVPNPQLKLKPGMTANVNVEIARRDDVVRVPNAALRFRPTPGMFTALGLTPPRGRGTAPVGAWTPPEGGRNLQGAGWNVQGAGRDQQSAGTNAQGAGGNAQTAGGNVQSAGWNAQTAGGNVQSAGWNAQGAGRNPQGAERNPQGAERNPQGAERNLQGAERNPRRAAPGAQESAPNLERRGRGGRRRGAAAPVAEAPPLPERGGATTFDALFGPLPQTETRGQVWLYVDNQLRPVRLRLGVSDGQFTELIEGDLEPGAEVVTNISAAGEAVRTRPTPGGFPPFMGGGNRGGGGGNRGGGNRGGGR